MTKIWMAEARELDGDGQWIAWIDDGPVEEVAEEARDFAEGILRPVGTRLVVRIFGPFDYEWDKYEQERFT